MLYLCEPQLCLVLVMELALTNQSLRCSLDGNLRMHPLIVVQNNCLKYSHSWIHGKDNIVSSFSRWTMASQKTCYLQLFIRKGLTHSTVSPFQTMQLNCLLLPYSGKCWRGKSWRKRKIRHIGWFKFGGFTIIHQPHPFIYLHV